MDILTEACMWVTKVVLGAFYDGPKTEIFNP